MDRNLRFNQAGDLVAELEQLVARADEQITATLIDQRLQTAQTAQTAQATPTQTPDYTQYFKSQMAGYGFVVSDLSRASGNTYNGTNCPLHANTDTGFDSEDRSQRFDHIFAVNRP